MPQRAIVALSCVEGPCEGLARCDVRLEPMSCSAGNVIFGDEVSRSTVALE